MIADTAYDADRIRTTIEARGATPVIPPHPSRARVMAYDQHLDQERHLVECFINKLEHCRGIATRYDKTATSFRASLVATLIGLR